MTYLQLTALVNEAYANFCFDYLKRQMLGADDIYSQRQLYFVKCIYKVLMNQEGDITKDSFTKEDIQNTIVLFNRMSNSTIQIEYT
jgi:hypothetical protein